MKNKIITFRESIRSTLSEILENDSKAILIGEDIGIYGGAFGVTRGLINKFSDRIIEPPISENSFVGVALGAAIGGYKPIVELMFSDFVTLAMDQIVNHAAKISYMYGEQLKAPMIIRLPSGGGRGYGASHSQSLESWFCHIPGLSVLYPSTPNDARGLLISATKENSPVIFFENKLSYDVKGEVNENEVINIGKAKTIKEGKDITIISYGRMLSIATKVSSELIKSNISVEIIDLRTLKPLDENLIINSVAKTGRVALLVESSPFSSVASEVISLISNKCFYNLKSPTMKFSALDTPIPSSTRLEKNIYPTAEEIVKKIYDNLST